MSFRVLRILGCAAISMVALCSNTFAADFIGTGNGPIPDNVPAGINVSFNTTTFNQSVGNVTLTLNLSHTFIRDLKVTLTSPGGISRLAIMSRVGLRTTAGGGSANLAGEYRFSDLGSDLWATASPLADGSNVPIGNYRASTQGAELVSGATNDGGGCYTSLAGAFAGLSASNASGIWTLNIADVASVDVGIINSSTLSLAPQSDAIFRNGFEIVSRGTCKLAPMDFTGRGRSSYVLLRFPATDITWFVKDNDSAAGGAETNFVLGDSSTDFPVQGDWDGDGIADAAVFRAVSGQFIIRPSSHPSLLRTQAYGQIVDNSTITDDFDGDGLTDFAVYREGASAGLPSRTLIKLNASGAERDFITGVNGNFPASGDYNGDGIADVATDENVSGAGSIRLFNGLTGAQFSTFVQGTFDEFIVDGNHIGSFFDDVTTVNLAGATMQWRTRDGATGVTQAPVPFGLKASDYPLNGDYDGDGLDDYSIWRRSTTPGALKFSVRPSSAPATTIDVTMGVSGDFPLGFARSH